MGKRVGLILLGVLVGLSLSGRLAGQAKADPAVKKYNAATGLLNRGVYKLAAQEFTEFLSAYGSHEMATHARYGLAVCNYRLKKYAEAVGALGQVLRDQAFAKSKGDEALMVLAHCHLELQDYAAALGAYDQLLGSHKASRHVELALLNRGQSLYFLKKLDEAAKVFSEFLQRYRDSSRAATAKYFLGQSQVQLGQWEPATKTLEGLLADHAKSPYDLDAMLLLGQCYEAQDRLDDAAKRYEAMVARAPAERRAEGQFSLGKVLYKSGKYALAARHLALAADHPGPYAAPARFQLGLAQLAGALTATARKTFLDVAKDDKERAVLAKYWLAQCDLADKKYPEARKALTQLLATKLPAAVLADAQFHVGLCLTMEGEHEQAAQKLADFRNRNLKSPRLGEATYLYAFCLHKLGRFAESLPLALGVAADKKSGFVRPAGELAAENLFQLKEYAKAAKGLEDLLKEEKDEAKVRKLTLRVGQCAYFTAQYDKAIAVLSPMVQASPKQLSLVEVQDAAFFLGDAQFQAAKYDEAVTTLARYLASSKDRREEAHCKMGLAQLRGGDAKAAERTFSTLLALVKSDSPWVLRAAFEYGQLCYRGKDASKAAEPLQRVAGSKEAGEMAGSAMYLLGSIALEAGKPPEAAKWYQEMLKGFGAHPLAEEASYRLAASLKEAGDAKTALAVLADHQKRWPAGKWLIPVQQLTGTCLASLGRHKEAAAALALLASNPKAESPALLYDLAWSLRSEKDAPAAAGMYRRLIEKYPADKLANPARVELADLLYKDEKYEEAALLLEKVGLDEALGEKNLGAARYRLGWCYVKLDKHDKAAAVFSELAARQPDSDLCPSAHYQAGVAYALVGSYTQAEAQFAALLKSNAKHDLVPVAQLKLGEVQAQLRAYDRAAATYAAFLAGNKDHKFAYLAWFGLGWAKENLKRYDDAQAAYAKVIEMHDGPTAARAQFQTGECYYAAGKYDQAVKELLKVDIVYDCPEWASKALLEAGRAFEQLKQPDEARGQYELCVKKYKQTSAGELAAKRLKDLAPQPPK